MLVEPIETTLSAADLFDTPDKTPSPWWPTVAMAGTGSCEWIEAEQMPRGKYFIGDPCYVLDESHLFLPQGVAHDIEGIGRVFWSNVDDLTPTDQSTTYYHDSMSVGMIPVDHLSPGHWAALKRLGRLIEWTNGDLVPEDEDDDWEGATMVGMDFLGNLYLGNDWWLTDDFLDSPHLPPSLAHLREEDA